MAKFVQYFCSLGFSLFFFCSLYVLFSFVIQLFPNGSCFFFFSVLLIFLFLLLQRLTSDHHPCSLHPYFFFLFFFWLHPVCNPSFPLEPTLLAFYLTSKLFSASLRVPAYSFLSFYRPNHTDLLFFVPLLPWFPRLLFCLCFSTAEKKKLSSIHNTSQPFNHSAIRPPTHSQSPDNSFIWHHLGQPTLTIDAHSSSRLSFLYSGHTNTNLVDIHP